MTLENVPNFRGITFAAGDFVSLFSLFFDNMSTLLGLSSAILALSPTSTLLPQIVYSRIFPAAGIMLFVGNVYYTYQAIRMAKFYNKPFTAQPYGLNTTGGFPFVFGIIYGVYYSYTPVCPDTGCDVVQEENDRVELAWKVCVTANFLTGLINIVLGFFGELLMQIFPVAAMLVPLAGIGFTWLALNQILPNFETPAIGLIPVFLIFTQYYGLGRFHIANGFYVPEALPVVIFGVAAGWAYGLNTQVASPVAGGAWIGGAFYEGFADIGPYMGIVLPFSIAASFGDMMCLVSAQKAGDPYNIRETMIIDGLGTLVGAILGSPFGTVVYIGHPVHKRVGARTGYSIMNGTIYLILGLSGIVPVILSLIPAIAIGPIIMIFGLMICEECTKHIPQRHHGAIFFGIFFGVCDYIYTNFSPEISSYGAIAMSKGSALSCLFWVAIIVYTTDRRWLRAGIFCCIAAVFAGAGIIHQSQAFSNFTSGTNGIDNDSPLQFMIGYFSMGAVTLLMYVLQTYMGKTTKEGDPGYDDDHGYLPAVSDTDGVDGIFETWWDPASGYITGVEESDEGEPVKKLEYDDEEAGKKLSKSLDSDMEAET
ncbi:purine nucleobase transmembrane transporter [Fragilaria crotonensis]|nr:purine nucleobase transmembrane transporter [Fragilaria crotonensis]